VVVVGRMDGRNGTKEEAAVTVAVRISFFFLLLFLVVLIN